MRLSCSHVLPLAVLYLRCDDLMPSSRWIFCRLEPFVSRFLLISLFTSSGSTSLSLLLHLHLQDTHATLQIVLFPLDRGL